MRNMRATYIVLPALTLIASVVLSLSAARAQSPGAPNTSPPETSVIGPEGAVSSGAQDILLVPVSSESKVPANLATARLCFQTYRSAMIRATSGETKALSNAASCLDLSDVNPLIRKERGEEIASELAKILDYSPPINPDFIPNEITGPPVTLLQRPEGALIIGLSSDGAWRFTKETVAVIPDIYRSMELAGVFAAGPPVQSEPNELSGGKVAQGMGIREMIPVAWKHKAFLLENWQWVFLLLLILIAILLDRIIPPLINVLLRFWFRKSILKDRKEILAGASRPFGLLAAGLFLWIALSRSGLGDAALVVFLTAAKFITAVGIVWCAYRAVDIIAAYVDEHSRRMESRSHEVLARFIRKSLKVLVTIFGIVFVLSNIDINVTSLLAGLGIGGIAVALAAKDALENLLGSIVVLLDKPFQVGDWVKIGDVEGSVEELGFRSTRIRTFYDSLVTVPNANVVKMNLDNIGARRLRRFKEKVSIEYGTSPEKIEALCDGIRRLILRLPYTHKDSYHVWLTELAESSFDIQVYCFLETPDWATELRERHRLLLDIIRLVNDLGISFAFPSRTIYTVEHAPPEPEEAKRGNIRDMVESERTIARGLADSIVSDELGGHNVIPPPVTFEPLRQMGDDSAAPD